MADSQPVVDHQPEPDLSNRVIGPYQVGRRLGRGGMADVYLAEQTSLRRQIALKVLHRKLAGDDSYVRRFHLEAQAAASLVHANIVQIYEVGCSDGIHYIAQEYVDGLNLKQFVARRGPLDARLALVVMRQVAAALHKAAQRGIIHRDIKPENIMLTPTGEVKVADFGLARTMLDGARLDLTQTGMTLGTPLYMSPEQVEGKKLDPRSDLYSFGITCYEMLVGSPPFQGDNPITVAVHHLKTEPERLEVLRRDLPGGLCRIVHQLMAKKPESRFASAADVLRDLRTIVVDGVEEWSLADEDWGSVAWETEAVRRLEATQKLATVMLHETRVPRISAAVVLLVVLVLASFGVGSAIAWIRRPVSLLEFDPSQLERIPRRETAAEQYYFAAFEYSKQDYERAFRAVIEYHPPDPAKPLNAEYVSRAKLALASNYDREGRTAEALALLVEVAEGGDVGWSQQATALIKLANIRERQGDTIRADEAISKVAPILARIAAEDFASVYGTQLEGTRLPRELNTRMENALRQRGASSPPGPSPPPGSGNGGRPRDPARPRDGS